MAETFHDVRFPSSISFGSSGGPERRTQIVALASGAEQRNSPWAHSRRRYDAGLGLRSIDDIHEIISFFEARQGRLYGFRWKDWTDWKSCQPNDTPAATDQPLGTGDGLTTDFAVRKTYLSGQHSYDRPIMKPIVSSLLVAIDGVPVANGADYSFDIPSGAISFSTPPPSDAIITAGFEFDVPVRFDSDTLDISLSGFQAGEIPSVPVVELLL